ncbi:monovalent cation/H(+) antiporter subunit G [Bacillus timonensis]|nr:monovalent cation/H(+) antiporter subunit G [Bacillus timonensis]
MTETLKIGFAVMILVGAFLSLVSSVGLIRLPDIYTRNHAASKSATLGILFILLGAFLFFWIEDGTMNARLLLGIVFVFITAPVAGHLISRAAYNSKVPLWEHSIQDDLRMKERIEAKE